MYYKFICVVIFTVVALTSSDAKRSRKNKYVNKEIDESTPQPSVLTYSTFGFNDVGSYDGFIPSSPDYANYLTHNKDTPSHTPPRIYAPAFPSSPESSFPTNYETQNSDQQMGVNNFQPPLMDFLTSPSSDYKSQNEYGVDNIYTPNGEEQNSPTYGAKLSTKQRNKPYSEYNRTNVNMFGSISPVIAAEATIEKNPLAHEMPTSNDVKPSFDESSATKQNTFKQSTNSQIEENGSYFKMYNSVVSPNPLKFPRVIDFTSLRENYPTSVSNKFLENSQKHQGFETQSNGNDNVRPTYNNFRATQPYKVKNNYEDDNNNKIAHENEAPKTNSLQYQDSPDKTVHMGNQIQNNKLDTAEHKEKLKNRPWLYSNYVDENNKNKNTMKGYQYSTNHSSTSFKYDYSPHKTQFNSSVDEIAPASSNQVYPSYQLPETDYSEFKKIPNFKSPYDPDSSNIFSFNQNKPEEYPYLSKNTYTTEPTVSSHWGNIFKTTDYSQYKTHLWKPQTPEDSNDDIVHIPKKSTHKPIKHIQYDDSNDDWSNSYRPQKIKPQLEWTDSIKNRFKSEEDLMGLRTHDTSRPHYLSSYRPSSYNDFDEDYEYKKLVDKWRQNYVKSKHKDSLREYESYASDHKPVHVPMPRPYHIEVPQPVIVPVPQPYPVNVPIPKPVAIPIIRELSVPIEKLVPYPVYKKVPYPIEKPVPVPVEKQVPVPVVKPYPVAIPKIKPIFHHTKPHDDDEFEPDEEYTRPEKKPYSKKLKSNTRSRSRPPVPVRRPSRMTYQDRNKRRPRPAASSNEYRYAKRPSRERRPSYKYREDFEEEYEPSEYYFYCKRTGNC